MRYNYRQQELGRAEVMRFRLNTADMNSIKEHAMKRWIFSAMSVAAVAFATTLLTAQSSDEPTSRPSGPWHENGSTSRPGGPGGHRGGFHLLPPFVMDKLNLTDDQKKALAELEKETKAKLDKILTDEQKKILDRCILRSPAVPAVMADRARVATAPMAAVPKVATAAGPPDMVARRRQRRSGRSAAIRRWQQRLALPLKRNCGVAQFGPALPPSV